MPYEHARLYHSTALLLPDGRVMIGGGGTPGPRNYTDVEYYSPSYLFDGNAAGGAPRDHHRAEEGRLRRHLPRHRVRRAVSRVTLVRNGSVTHGFNNDQNFQDLAFTQDGGGTVTITSPDDGTYAPPGAYMLFVFDADGTPSVADDRRHRPRGRRWTSAPRRSSTSSSTRACPPSGAPANPPTTVDVAAGQRPDVPVEVSSQVQLVRGTAPGQGGLGLTGYHLALGSTGQPRAHPHGASTRDATYRISLRYARDSRSAGTAPATATLSVGDLDTTLTATTDLPSQPAAAPHLRHLRRAPSRPRPRQPDARPRGDRWRRHDDRRPGGRGRGRRSLRTSRSTTSSRRARARPRPTPAPTPPSARRPSPAPPAGPTQRRPRRGGRPARRRQRQRRRPAGQPAAGRGRLHDLVLGAPGREGQLDRPVPHR